MEQVLTEPTQKTNKKTAAEKHKEVLRLWRETSLNKTQIAKAVGINSLANVRQIIKRNAAYRDDADPETPDDENPCRVKIKSLPVCFGVGCYLAGSLCPAYVASQKRPALL